MKKSHGIFLVLFLVTCIITLSYGLQSILFHKNVTVFSYANKVYKNVNFAVATTSPSDIPVILSIGVADNTFDLKDCLSSGYDHNVNSLDLSIICVWGSETELFFALQDKSRTNIYITKIDFAAKKYTDKDFEYYQSFVPKFMLSTLK